MRRPTLVVATTVLLAAALTGCATSRHRASGPVAPPPTATLLLASGSGIEAVSATTGARQYQVDGGVATADRSAVMATEGEQLVIREAKTGAVRQTVPVGPNLAIDSVSPDGLLVALSATAIPSYLPTGRTTTRLVVVHLAGPTVRSYDLAGNLAPDAFSTDGGSLFLVSYLPPAQPDRYQITSLILDTGEILGVFGWQKEALEDMRGRAGTRVLAPNRSTLYTLYLRPPALPGGATDDLRAEVHTLKLDKGWAHCVDLPAGFGSHDLTASALAVSPSGTRLYVVDRALRQLVEIDTASLAITRSVSVPLSNTTGPTLLVADGDGHLALSDGPDLVVIDAATLAVARRWPTGGPVTALVAAGGGTGVLASRPGYVDTFSATGGRTATMVVPADATVIGRLLA